MKTLNAMNRMTTCTFVKSFRRNYLFCALTLLNTLVAFALLNLGLFFIIYARDLLYSDDIGVPLVKKAVAQRQGEFFASNGSPVDNGKRNSYQLASFDFTADQSMEAAYTGDVLDDFYELGKLGFIYQPWVQFSEPPFTGKRVNVDIDQRGFPVRRTVNPSNIEGLPVVQIFALGGSTTFGYNVSDEHTWPSYLSKILNEKSGAEGLGIHIQVTNYGRGYYNPSQEAILVTDLLKSGHRPSLVIFMDGVNPTTVKDVPRFTEEISRHVKNLQFITNMPLIQRFEWLPVVRLAQFLRLRLFEENPDPNKRAVNESNLYRIDYVLNSFVQNREIAAAICNLYSAKTLFFLQPNAFYNYSLKLYRMPMRESFIAPRDEARRFYERLRAKAERIYLGDLFELWGHDKKAIIDDVHYTPSFNRFLAQHVANYIRLKTLKPLSTLIDKSAATGVPRHSLDSR